MGMGMGMGMGGIGRKRIGGKAGLGFSWVVQLVYIRPWFLLFSGWGEGRREENGAASQRARHDNSKKHTNILA